MRDLGRLSKETADPILFDCLTKFPKSHDESRDNFLKRVAKERRAMIFANMAMDRIGGCWDDDEGKDHSRKTPDLMFRWHSGGRSGSRSSTNTVRSHDPDDKSKTDLPPLANRLF